MKDRIELHSRYINDKHYLERIGDETSKKYLLHAGEYCRFGITDNPDVYSFVDPSGGPFIQKETVIDNMIVKSIYKDTDGIIVEFE